MGFPKMIYTRGDSHSWHCWCRLPAGMVAPFTSGPMTLYHYGKYRPLMSQDVPLDAIIVFCWGEIDCRCHVFKHPPFLECIDELVVNYREAIKVSAVGRDPKNIWVYNIVPPPHRDHLPNLEPENKAFPFLGSDAERLSFVKRMNEDIRKMCAEEGWQFVDIYDKVSLPDGFLDPKISDDQVHVSKCEALKEWIDAHT